MQSIILASASKRRKRLLEQLGISFICKPSSVVEESSNQSEPHDYVYQLAYRKAERVALEVEDALVIGADTVIFHRDKIIGKPRDEEDAFSILSSLSGERHQVFTAFVIINSNTLQYEKTIQQNDVYFRSLTATEIREYIHTGEPFDKAGAYAIQGKGASFILRIEGCFYGVMGLPLGALVPALYKMGWKGRMYNG